SCSSACASLSAVLPSRLLQRPSLVLLLPSRLVWLLLRPAFPPRAVPSPRASVPSFLPSSAQQTRCQQRVLKNPPSSPILLLQTSFRRPSQTSSCSSSCVFL